MYITNVDQPKLCLLIPPLLSLYTLLPPLLSSDLFTFASLFGSVLIPTLLPFFLISGPLLTYYFSFILFSFSSAQSLCLSDEPRAVKEYQYPEKLPGELYDADTQCKWQFGEKAKLCTLDFKKVKLILTKFCHAMLI